jgi:hypothetical protein
VHFKIVNSLKKKGENKPRKKIREIGRRRRRRRRSELR